MLRKVGVLICLLLAGCAAMAQKPELLLGEKDNPFVPGIIVGANVSKIRNCYYNNFSKVGMNAGLSMQTRLSGTTWLGIELLYSQKGCIGVQQLESIYVGTFFEKYYLKLNYVEVPVYLNIPYKSWGHFTIGASYSALINEKEKMLTDVPVYIDPEIYYSNKHSVDVLGGVQLHVSPSLYLNVRYQQSVTKVRNYQQVHYRVGYQNQFSSSIAFQLMYMLRKG